jgi:tetratricopeptide (TPR) repeat protein
MTLIPRSLRVPLVGVALLFGAAARLDASAESRQMTAQAFQDAYNLEFAACYARLETAARLDPADPAPPRAMAAITWMEMLFSQGAATFEAFTGQASGDDVVRPVTPPALNARFKTNIARALQLAEAALKTNDDADSHYQMGATTALLAIYGATIEGRTIGGLSDGRRAVKEMERARKLAPGRRETGMVLGISEYTVSTLSAPARWVARVFGLSGNKAEALQLLEEAATAGSETEADALLLLMIVYNREGNRAEAAKRLGRLQARFPGNRLLWLNAATIAIETGQFDVAERHLTAGLAARDLEAPPPVLGERAMWLLKRGTARAALGRAADAVADLTQALAAGPRDWVRGRTHLELAKLARTRHDDPEAASQLRLAIEFGKRGGDQAAVRAAEALVKQTRKN